LKGLILTASGALGNAATRIDTYVVGAGAYAYGGYTDIDDLFRQQAVARDRGKREALLHQIQRLMHERVMLALIYDFRALQGVGPRVPEHTIDAIPMDPLPSYEGVRLK
jgi:peptide/nickel transport system substrate-binding protein